MSGTDDPNLPCENCGRDNRNGTHKALERTGHLSHPWRPAPSTTEPDGNPPAAEAVHPEALDKAIAEAVVRARWLAVGYVWGLLDADGRDRDSRISTRFGREYASHWHACETGGGPPRPVADAYKEWRMTGEISLS